MRFHELLLSEKRIVLDPNRAPFNRAVVVFENPSAQELRSLLGQFGELRGFAAPTGPLYVWDAHDWTHHTIAKYLGDMDYYLYFSKTPNLSTSDTSWRVEKLGDIYVGVGYEDLRGKERPDIPLRNPMVKRAIGLQSNLTKDAARNFARFGN